MAKIRMLVIALAAALVVACGYVLLVRWGDGGRGRMSRMDKVRGEFAAKKVNGSNWIAPPPKRAEAVGKPESDSSAVASEGDEGLTEEDERLVDGIHEALNEEDLALAIALAKRAVASKSANVRSEMVDTLRFFGDKVMPELLPFVDDPDEGVRIDAMAAFQQAIYDIEDDSAKAQVVEIAMRNLDDADALEQIAAELVGMDELLAVQTLVNVIDGESKTGRRIAKATYETVTGEAFTTFEAAEAWIRGQRSSK